MASNCNRIPRNNSNAFVALRKGSFLTSVLYVCLNAESLIFGADLAKYAVHEETKFTKNRFIQITIF